MPGGIQNYQLVIDARVSGQAEIQRMNQALTGAGREMLSVSKANETLTSSSERARTSLATLGAEAYLTAKAARAIAGEFAGVGVALASHVDTTQKAIGVYREARLAYASFQSVLAGSAAPLVSTAAVLGIGLLAEKTGEFMYRQAQLIEQTTAASVTLNTSVETVNKLSLASQLAGKESGYLSTTLQALAKSSQGLSGRAAFKELGIDFQDANFEFSRSPKLLSDVAAAIAKVEDPTKRVHLAMALLGTTDVKALDQFKLAASSALAEADRFGATLSREGSAGVLKFKSDVDDLKAGLPDLGREFTLLGHNIQVGTTDALGKAYSALRQFGVEAAKFAARTANPAIPQVGTVLGDQGIREPGGPFVPGPLTGLLPTTLTDDELRKGIDFKDITLQSSRALFAENVSNSVAAYLKKYQDSRDGVKGALAAAEDRLGEVRRKILADDQATQQAEGGVLSADKMTGRERMFTELQLQGLQQVVTGLKNRAEGFKNATEAAEAAKKRQEELDRVLSSMSLRDLNRLDPLRGFVETTQTEFQRIASGSPLTAANISASTAQYQRSFNAERLRTLLPTEDLSGFGGFVGDYSVTLPNGTTTTASALGRLQSGAPQNPVLAANDPRRGFQYGFQRPTPNLSENLQDPAGERVRYDLTQRLVSGAQEYARYREQAVNLTTGPGGERDAVEAIARIRLESAQRAYDLTKDRAQFERDSLDIQRSKTLELLSLDRERTENYRNMAGQLYDQGPAGFLRSQANQLGRQLFVNASTPLFQAGGQFLGRLGAASGLPTNLLKGSILDPSNAAAPIDKNTSSLDRLTTSVDALNARITLPGMSGSGGGGAVASTTTGLFGKIFGGATSNPFIFNANKSTAQNSGWLAEYDPFAGVLPKQPSTLSRTVGIGGVLSGAAFGAYSGFSAGGAQGALTGTSSLLGGAAGLLPLLGVSGPAAPLIGALALGVGLFSALLGDPKQKRAQSLDREAKSRAFTEPTGADYISDQYGRSIATDYLGSPRPVVNNFYTTNNVNAMDSASFEQYLVRNPTALASGMSSAIMGGNADDVVGNIGNILGVR